MKKQVMNGSAKLLLDVYRCVHIIVSEQMCTGENRANICVINLGNPIKPKIFFFFFKLSVRKKYNQHVKLVLKSFICFMDFRYILELTQLETKAKCPYNFGAEVEGPLLFLNIPWYAKIWFFTCLLFSPEKTSSGQPTLY